MGRFLTDVVGFANCVPVAGSVEYVDADGTVWTLALLQAQVANQGDAWRCAVDQLAAPARAPAPADGDAPTTRIAAMVERMQVLARRIAELHVALARRTGDPAFDPEPVPPPTCSAGRRRCATNAGARWRCWPSAASAGRQRWPRWRRGGRLRAPQLQQRIDRGRAGAHRSA